MSAGQFGRRYAMVRAVVLCGVLLVFTSVPAADPAKLRQWIAFFKAQDGAVDAATNKMNSKIYVIGAMGVGSYYPGIGNAEGDKVAKAHVVKYLPETSDAIESDIHREYIDVATKYAAEYNRTTLKLLGIPHNARESKPSR
jgi:hypothetical protein